MLVSGSFVNIPIIGVVAVVSASVIVPLFISCECTLFTVGVAESLATVPYIATPSCPFIVILPFESLVIFPPSVIIPIAFLPANVISPSFVADVSEVEFLRYPAFTPVASSELFLA